MFNHTYMLVNALDRKLKCRVWKTEKEQHLKTTNCWRFLLLNGTVGVISSNPSCKEGNSNYNGILETFDCSKRRKISLVKKIGTRAAI